LCYFVLKFVNKVEDIKIICIFAKVFFALKYKYLKIK
jgi:hypothetical protein